MGVFTVWNRVKGTRRFCCAARVDAAIEMKLMEKILKGLIGFASFCTKWPRGR